MTLDWATSWAIARRDLHAGFRGLRLLFACLFLGVATLAAIGSLTAAITSELGRRGQTLLGGDLEIGISQRAATPEELKRFAQLGQVSATVRTRAMAQRNGQSVLSALKGVDRAYPLYGRLALAGGSGPLSPNDIFVDRAMVDRLGVSVGSSLRYGEAEFRVRAIITDEPDRVGEGFTLGPVGIVSREGFDRTKLIQPGSLYTSKYRIRLAPGSDAAVRARALKREGDTAGWEIKDRDRAAPGMSRFFERMGQFLSLIGLTALVIAGIGVGNGVTSYLALKRNAIATFKILGATSADITRIYRMQIGAVALLAVAAGLIVGALLPGALIAVAGDLLPVRPGFNLYPKPLATSAGFGLLIALAFSVAPLARARTLPAAALFRALVELPRAPDRGALLRIAGLAVAIIALALLTAREPLFSAAVLGATGAVLALLLAIGWAVKRLTARLPRPKHPLWRLALTNLHRPGAQTHALIIALGLALTLFVTLAAIQSSLTAEMARTVPKVAPNQFVLDIPVADQARFRNLVSAQAPEARINLVPTLRGTITAFGGQRVADLATLPQNAWFLRGERGVTYGATLPEGSELVAGRWWPRDYRGPPLVSLDRDAAEVMKIGIGDTITVSVLGREIEARIASLRQVNWDTMGFNYIMVFTPQTFAAAPHSVAATISLDPRHEAPVSRAILTAFPASSIIAVSEIIGQVTQLLGQMSTAILLAASVAILAGIAVLIGAIAASRQSRSYDSVILKTLGATRGQILAAQALEYGALAALLALVALALGLGAGWYVITQVFEFGWAPDWLQVFATLALGTLGTLAIGLIGAWPLISVRPAQALRAL